MPLSQRAILHCDMNNYFAAVEEKYDPSLKKIPFAVCGNPEMRHSIVMSKNGLAKSAGVITGLSYAQAKKVCPGLGYVRADYRKYLRETRLAREIYLKYTDSVIPYGLDEAWVDLTASGATMAEARQIADLIRIEIMYSQGLSASVGVSDNYIFSKLGSDMALPNATSVITRENFKRLVWPLPAQDLLFVGKQTAYKLAAVGIFTIGDIAASTPGVLSRLLGKAGFNLWHFAHGDDRGFKPDADSIKSIGNTITAPADLSNNREASAIIYLLVNSVSARLKKHRMKTCCVSVCMKDSAFNQKLRQTSFKTPTDDAVLLFNRAYELFTRHYSWENPLRSVGVRADRLYSPKWEQTSLFGEERRAIGADIDARVVELTAKFGKINFEKSAATREWKGSLNICADATPS